ncbi:protein NDUFAF4 homolog [Toxorhynchites rutilus septentrionalis]|uniref:protein NDUFAF4 homolog n=1 Tax=Toxorhynchites rutilus septentrionalis TaxID=329112 RepID=UPI002478A8BC|nr:protein NDUFAF4 homolog [Toxorhynchites rutilus septentrionalis]XP_055630996.1 protein NDUFAF4 homolog [Toxorhynchites rutilus septentrionalis]
MGKLLSVAARQINRFNVENRAQKVISQDKPKPAPMYSSNLKDLQRVLDEHPELLNEQRKKNELLERNLKQVYVTSTDPVDMSQKDVSKPLPANRVAAEEFEFGHMEPTAVTKGHCTLRQAIDFIAKYNSDPILWTVDKIVEEYRMKESVVRDILDHFKTFELHLPSNNRELKYLKSPTNETRQIKN